MSKVTLNTVASGFYGTTALNSNFQTIMDAFDNTLSLDGSTPNSMNADLDMNGNNILNSSFGGIFYLGQYTVGTEPVVTEEGAMIYYTDAEEPAFYTSSGWVAFSDLVEAVAITETFDGLAPTTTEGDLVLHNGITNTRLAIGAASTVLTSNGTTASWETVASSLGKEIITGSHSGTELKITGLPADKIVQIHFKNLTGGFATAAALFAQLYNDGGTTPISSSDYYYEHYRYLDGSPTGAGNTAPVAFIGIVDSTWMKANTQLSGSLILSNLDDATLETQWSRSFYLYQPAPDDNNYRLEGSGQLVGHNNVDAIRFYTNTAESFDCEYIIEITG